MDKDFVKMFLLSGILFVCGVMMIETPITCWKEFSLMAKICMPIFGLLFLIPAFIIFTVTFGEYKKKYNLEKNNRLQVDKGGLPANDLFGKFRKDYADFLLTESGKENPEVQNDVTQMFRNIIDLRAKRLKSMNIQCKFESIRTNHTSLPPLQRENFSDGKYKIQSVREDVIASTSFLKDKDTIYTRTDKDVARYTVASAKHISDHELVCPSCGATQTKEQLLDGCDYCGTKFMIEDLEEKISDFALRSDYELQYERYKEARSNFTPKVFIYTDLFWVVLYTIYTLFNFSKFRAYTGMGAVSTVVCVPILMIFFAMPFAGLAVVIFNAFIFPFIQLGASLRYASKKILDKQRLAEAGNRKMQDLVKKVDPYFSISSFYSNVQNKLATVHFADSSEQLNAFSLCDLSPYREKYKSVIDMNVEYIRLKDYSVSEGLQKARVEVALKLVSYNGRKCSVEKESISMLFTKSAECKTQVVCAPAVMRCKGCGASLSFLEGKKCKFCGKEMDLENHDWVIREYCNFEL